MSQSLSKLEATPKRFLRLIAQGYSIRGAAALAGIVVEEAYKILSQRRVLAVMERFERMAEAQLARLTREEAQKVLGISEGFILSRAKALEKDPATPAATRLTTLQFLSDLIKTGKTESAQTERSMSVEKLVELATEVRKQAPKNDAGTQE